MSLLRSGAVQFVETGKKTKSKSGASSQKDVLRQVNRSARKSAAEKNADFKRAFEKIAKDSERKGLSNRKLDRTGWTEAQKNKYIKARDMNKVSRENRFIDDVFRRLGRKPKFPTYYESQAPARKRAKEKENRVFAAKTFVDKMRATRKDIFAATVVGLSNITANNRYPNEQQMKTLFKNKVYKTLCFAESDERRLLIEQGLLKELALWLTWSTMWSNTGNSSMSKYEPSRAKTILSQKGQKLIHRWEPKNLYLIPKFDGTVMYDRNPRTGFQRYVGYDLSLVNMIVRCLVGGTVKEYQVDADRWGVRKKTLKKMSHFPWYKTTGRTSEGRAIIGWDSEMEDWDEVNYALNPTNYNFKDSEIKTRRNSDTVYAAKTRFDIWGKYGGMELYQAINSIILIATTIEDPFELETMFPDGKPQEFGLQSLLTKYGKTGELAEREHDVTTKIWARLTMLNKAWEKRAVAYDTFERERRELQEKTRKIAKAQGEDSSDEEMGSGDSSDSSSSEESESDWFDEDE